MIVANSERAYKEYVIGLCIHTDDEEFYEAYYRRHGEAEVFTENNFWPEAKAAYEGVIEEIDQHATLPEFAATQTTNFLETIMGETFTKPVPEFEITRNPRNGPNNTTYQVINLSWNVPTMVKGLADCGNANDPRNIAFAEWVKAKLEAAYAAGEHLPFLCRRD